MRLSIIIPTCERVKYLEHSIKTALAIRDTNVEIIVSDNASTDGTFKVLSKINDPRFKYINTGKRVSMRANFENGIRNSTGDYIMYFGDDDGCLPGQISILKNILEKEKPDVLKWPILRYGWPELGNSKTGRIRLKKRSVFGEIYEIDSKRFLKEILNCNLKNDEYFPAIYHGVVSRDYLENLKTSDGQIFNCTIPDVYFGYLALFKGGKFIYCDHPFTLNGYSPVSNGGAQKQIDLGNATPDITQKFIIDNSYDENRNVADFGVSLAASFFLAIETARVVSDSKIYKINYLAWFEFMVSGVHKMEKGAYNKLINSLKIYAREIGKIEDLTRILEMPKKNYNLGKLKKIKRKFHENLAKMGSIQFLCNRNSANNIYYASQICDELLGRDLEYLLEKTKTRKSCWSSLIERYSKI